MLTACEYRDDAKFRVIWTLMCLDEIYQISINPLL